MAAVEDGLTQVSNDYFRQQWGPSSAAVQPWVLEGFQVKTHMLLDLFQFSILSILTSIFNAGMKLALK